MEYISKLDKITKIKKIYIYMQDFQELLTSPATADKSNPLEATYTNQTDTAEELEKPPDILDIEMAIQSMNNNTSPGIDNNPTKLYRKGGGLLLNKIHSLIKGIWREEKMPTDWS